MVAMATLFIGPCPKLNDAYISLEYTFLLNLIKMWQTVKSTAQTYKSENFSKKQLPWHQFSLDPTQNLINCLSTKIGKNPSKV